MTTTTIGTHNLHDLAGWPTPFADVILFTEAVPARVREFLEPGYVVRACRWQKDLVIAWRRGTFVPTCTRYRLAHPGIPKVTPRRGTFIIEGHLGGVPTALVAEHRINAAFPPFIRGERLYRPRMWQLHTSITRRTVRRLLERGYVVLAGGDLNTPRGVSGYKGLLREYGHGFDRIAASARLEAVETLSREGSDHPRLRAELRSVNL